MAISKQYLQLFDVKPWSHHHQKATIERAPTIAPLPAAQCLMTPGSGMTRRLLAGVVAAQRHTCSFVHDCFIGKQ